MATKGMGLIIALGLGIAAVAVSSSGKKKTPGGAPRGAPGGTGPVSTWTQAECQSKWDDYMAREFDKETDPAKNREAAALFRDWGWTESADCMDAKASGSSKTCYPYIYAEMRDSEYDAEGLRIQAEFARAYGLHDIGKCFDRYADAMSTAA